MKLKEINRTAIQAWSPAQQHPVYLATGTSAQQLDASFSTSASLEVFQLDLTDPTLDMKTSGTFTSPHRYHKMVWGPAGTGAGVLIAGTDNGDVILYDPAKIMTGDSSVVIDQSDKHTGPVRALDVNSFQSNLFASGGNESEIYIWDLNSFNSPMVPGPKSQPLEDISCIAWNCQVQHILASASPSGRASIWDLRKNDLIIKVSDHSNRMHCSGLAWHPEVATQLVLASEDDRMPVIQMWDLRFATSPLKVLENHTRGVLAIAWSLADPELLLSSGKDNRILCWNPNTAEVLYELPTSSQWCFDIQWCPRNPALLSAASFDGHISVYSIMGGGADAVSRQQADQLSASFGNLDPFGTGQPLPPLQLPQAAATSNATVTPLKKPPKWIRRPVGASFAFGGKLVSLENGAPQTQPSQQPQPRMVQVSQVVTETEFLERSSQLQATLAAGSFAEFCQGKMDTAPTEFEKAVWSFLKVNFEDDSRGKYLDLLGYKKEELASKIAEALEKKKSQPAEALEEMMESEPLLETPADPEPQPDPPAGPGMDGEPEDEEVELEAKEEDAEEVKSEENGVAEDLVEEGLDDPSEGAEAAIPTQDPCVGPEVVPQPSGPVVNELVNVHKINKDVDNLITQALLTGDFESAVNLCLHDNRMADSIILAIAGGPELLEKTQKKYFLRTQTKITKLISAVVTKDWLDILETCDLHSWREALAAVMTYATPDDFSSLCGLLGSRLEQSEDSSLQAQACLCYICAGNLEKLVGCWTKAQESQCPLSLQDLVEKVVILQQAVERSHGTKAAVTGTMLAQKMSQYASLLAAQGSLVTALAYLPEGTNQEVVEELRVRLTRALGKQSAPVSPPQGVAPTPQAPAAQAMPSNMPAATPAYFNPHATQPVAAVPAQPPVPATQQYYQPMRSASTVTSWSNQTPTALPSTPRPLGPVPEPQANSGAPGFGLQTSTPAAGPPSFAGGYVQSQQYPQRPLNGWNDPPTLTRGPKKKKGLDNYTPPAPILAPIMSPLGGEPQQPSADPAHSHPHPQQPLQPGLQAPYNPLQQQPQQQPATLVPSSGPPTLPVRNMEGAPGAPIGDHIQTTPMPPVEKISKKPIPEEHLVLKTTFEGLVQKCLAAAHDPQTKRKLDVANKRLELLYDKLREQSLSPAIVGGLHNMVRCIESRAYTDGLNIHTHIVSSSNFSDISAFMPVLKVLLTEANKLGV